MVGSLGFSPRMNEHAHGVHHHGGAGTTIALAVVTVSVIGYVAMALRQGRDPRGWNVWRGTAFVGGCLMVAIGWVPEALPYAEGDFRKHMLQHLLIGMVAPTALVLGAPITLLLRSMTPGWARVVVRVIRSLPVRLLAHPLTALTLNLGGMAALYLTPIYEAAGRHPALHHAMHVHFLLAGCLFAWVIAGPDPAPHRPSVPTRLVVLGVAIAIHASLSQLLYAGVGVALSVPSHELRGGAELMYYGGDIAELLLAFALVSSWRPRPERRVVAP